MLKHLVDTSPATAGRPELNTRVVPHLRIINGALDDDPTSPAGLILLGRIDPATFRFLRIDDKQYQRRQDDRQDLFQAIKEGKIPPQIDIGVRGQDFFCDGGDYIIRSPAYIIDGGGRIGAATKLLDLVSEMNIRLFAMCHFNTDAQFEAERFDVLNRNVRKVSSSLHLRNMREKNAAILTLYGLSESVQSFPLYKRVCWGDAMARGHLIRATVLVKTALVLHSHFTSLTAPSLDQLCASLLRASEKISLSAFRQNVATFFSILDSCWPVRAIEYRHSATQTKAIFLWSIAKMFAEHDVFWSGPERHDLFVDADDRRKLAKFPVTDPTVINLAGSAGKARNMLYQMLVDHMNSGRRTQRLRPRTEVQ